MGYLRRNVYPIRELSVDLVVMWVFPLCLDACRVWEETHARMSPKTLARVSGKTHARVSLGPHSWVCRGVYSWVWGQGDEQCEGTSYVGLATMCMILCTFGG